MLTVENLQSIWGKNSWFLTPQTLKPLCDLSFLKNLFHTNFRYKSRASIHREPEKCLKNKEINIHKYK